MPAPTTLARANTTLIPIPTTDFPAALLFPAAALLDAAAEAAALASAAVTTAVTVATTTPFDPEADLDAEPDDFDADVELPDGAPIVRREVPGAEAEAIAAAEATEAD